MTFGNDRGTAAAPGAASVMAAMSGGVDSSVCALLLQQAGYDVRGATMVLRGGEVLGDAGKGEGSTCGSARDVEDARAVCRRLGIPHDAFNLRDRFDAAVVNPFCGAYLEGRTPNPCIACNRFLKFEALQKRRRQLGLDYVATGHYARRRWDEATGCWQLLRASDPAKDQSYVLYLSTFNESVIGHALSDANLSFNLLFTAQPHVFVSDKHPLASRTEVTVEDLEDYPRYAFEQGANNSFFYSEEPLAELPHTKCISVSDRGTLSNLLAHHNGYTISTGVLSSEMYTGIASVPLQTKELMRVGYIVHNERQLSPLAQSYIEKLSLFVEGYQIGLAGL